MTSQINSADGAIMSRGLRLAAKAETYADIAFDLTDYPLCPLGAADVLVEIHAAAVNPSDAKAATGLMPYAVFPRTPGRDYAGKVIAGPDNLIGRMVFGSSGDLGIRQDGSHATHMVVEADAVVEVPPGITPAEAAGIGVPFVTAWEGLKRARPPQEGETVLVLGLNGKVGQAVTQIATARGARVIGVVRRDEGYEGHANGAVDVVVTGEDADQQVRELTGGKGVDLVFNAVGDPLYDLGQKSMAVGARAVFIAAVKRFVTFDILSFYKGQHTYLGIDTIALGSVASGAILRELAPDFAAGKLKPFPIHDRATYRLDKAYDAYQAVMGSSRDRVVLLPRG